MIPDGEGDARDWSDWGTPSECSRICGGGVSSQTRVCLRPEYVLSIYNRSTFLPPTYFDFISLIFTADSVQAEIKNISLATHKYSNFLKQIA